MLQMLLSWIRHPYGLDKLMKTREPPFEEGQSVFSSVHDIQSVYSYFCERAPTVIFHPMITDESDSLFYTTVLAQDKIELKGMLDTGSMASTLRADILLRLREAGLQWDSIASSNIVFVGCSGNLTSPVGICDLKLQLYRFSYSVPVLIVEGLSDELIIGINALKPMIKQFKSNDRYWRVAGNPYTSCQSDNSQFYHLLSDRERWRGNTIPDKVDTVKLKCAVTLQPRSEGLV